jgi:hypothetical protein
MRKREKTTRIPLTISFMVKKEQMKGVVNWFRKDRAEVKGGEELWSALKRTIWANQHKGRQNDVGSFATILAGCFKDTEVADLMRYPSDDRLPICSLYHHLMNTAGLAVCFAIDKGYGRDSLDKIRVASFLHDIGTLTEQGNGGKQVEELLSRINWLEDTDKHYIIAVMNHQEEAELIAKADCMASASDRRYEVE